MIDMWKEYILEKSNSVTFPKDENKVGYVMQVIEGKKVIIDVTPYSTVNCMPYECTEEELSKDKESLELHLKERHPGEPFGYIVKCKRAKHYACLVIFQDKQYYKYLRRDLND